MLILAKKTMISLFLIIFIPVIALAQSVAESTKPPQDMRFIFPHAAQVHAETGSSCVRFVKNMVKLKHTDGVTQVGYYYFKTTRFDILGNQIAGVQERIKEAKSDLKRLTPHPATLKSAKKIRNSLKQLQDQLKELQKKRANLNPYGRFVNAYFANAKLRLAMLTRWYATDKTIDEVKSKAVSFHDNAYTRFEPILSDDLGLCDEGKYTITALISQKTGKAMQYLHWAYFRKARYWVQIATPSDSAKPLKEIIGLLRCAAEALGEASLFTITTPDGGVPAEPKDVTNLTITAHGLDGKPLADTSLSLQLIAPDSPLIGGALKGADDDGVLTLKTDANGTAKFTYIPPDIDRALVPKLMDIGRGVREPIQQYVSVISKTVSGAGTIKLAWPYPKVVSFGLGSGVEAGYWGKRPAILKVSDIDSNRFTYKVIAVGKLRQNIKMSPITESKAVWTGGDTLEFLYCPPKMGLDLTNLPDLRRELVTANVKFAAEYIDNIVKAPGVRKLVSEGGRGAVEIGKNVIGAAKTGYSYVNYVNGILNSQGPTDSKKVAGLIKDTTALLNDVVSTVDSFTGGGKMNPTIEVGKWLLANLNTIEQVHSQNWKIATSYEDIVFLPVRVEIADPEGHTTVVMRKVGVKFPRSQ